MEMNHDRYFSNYILLFIHKEAKWKYPFLSQPLEANSEIISSKHVITSILEPFIIGMLSRYKYVTTNKFYR